MKKTLKMKIRGLTKKQFEHLKALCQSSKNLYNQALYATRQHYYKTGEHLSYGIVDRLMKETLNLEGEINYRKMKAGVSQQILRRLDKNYKSFFRLIKNPPADMKPKPPKYIRGELYNLIFDCQRFQIRDGRIILDKVLSVKIPCCLTGRKIVQVEIVPKYGYFAAVFVCNDDTEYDQIPDTGKTMGIDLGLNNLAACATDKGELLLINGKPLKSINQFYNKTMAGVKSDLAKRNGNQKWSEKAQRLTDKRNNKINDYQHKASREIVNFCLEKEVSKVVIGNVAESVNGINLGKKNNQNFVNIALGQFVNKIIYKLETHGVKVVMSDESFTSKASFFDNDFLPEKHIPGTKHTFSGKRVMRGLYNTASGKLVNADINGALNIIRKAVPEFNFQKLKDGIEGRFIPHCKLLTCQWNLNIQKGDGIMEYSVVIPDRIAMQLENCPDNVSQQFREALAVQKYRTREFTAFQVGEMLGHTSRWETDAFLKKHHCYGYTEEDFEKDGRTLDRLLEEAAG